TLAPPLPLNRLAMSVSRSYFSGDVVRSTATQPFGTLGSAPPLDADFDLDETQPAPTRAATVRATARPRRRLVTAGPVTAGLVTVGPADRATRRGTPEVAVSPGSAPARWRAGGVPRTAPHRPGRRRP